MAKDISNLSGNDAVTFQTAINPYIDEYQSVRSYIPSFMGNTQPIHVGPFIWWNTTGGVLQLYIEDGE